MNPRTRRVHPVGAFCLFLALSGCGKPAEKPKAVTTPLPAKTVLPKPVVKTVTPPAIVDERKEASLLKNGSFEDWPSDDAKLATGWVSLYGQPIEAGRSADAKEGKFAQWVSGNDPDKRGGVVQIFDDATSFAGKQVKISGWVKTAETPAEVTVQLVGQREGGGGPYFVQTKLGADNV